MDRSSVIYLVDLEYSQNEVGVYEKSQVERKVFCQVDSITLSEWSEGGRNGLNPEYRMTMLEAEYKGEEVLRYNGQFYAIYRTYKTRNDYIELYVEKRKGRESGN